MNQIELKQVSPIDNEVVKLIDALNQYQLSLYETVKCNLESPEEMILNNSYMLGAFENEVLIGIGSIKL